MKIGDRIRKVLSWENGSFVDIEGTVEAAPECFRNTLIRFMIKVEVVHDSGGFPPGFIMPGASFPWAFEKHNEKSL